MAKDLKEDGGITFVWNGKSDIFIKRKENGSRGEIP